MISKFNILALGLLTGCVEVPDIEVATEFGRHDLPFRPNERFVITESKPIEDYTDSATKVSLTYFLDGKRRFFRTSEKGYSDGYVTYLGRITAPEYRDVESAIMDECVIELASGEQITVTGNTVNPGEVRLLKRNRAAEQAAPSNP